MHPWYADRIYWDSSVRKSFDLNYVSVDAPFFRDVYRLLLCHGRNWKDYIVGSTQFADLNGKMFSLQRKIFSSKFHDAPITPTEKFLKGNLFFK